MVDLQPLVGEQTTMVKLRGIKTLITNWASFMVKPFDTQRCLSTGLHTRVYDKAEVSIEWNWRKEISSQKNFDRIFEKFGRVLRKVQPSQRVPSFMAGRD